MTLQAAAISGSGGVTKLGLGILTLGNLGNSYSGGSTISGGVLQFATGAMPSSGSITINAGGALANSGPYTTVVGWLGSGLIAASTSGAIAVSGVNTEAIDLTAAGGGAYTQLSLAAAGNATFSGTLIPATGQPYRFGGGGGNLTVTTDLTSASNLVATGPGVTLLTSTNNNYGTTTVSGGGSLDTQSNLGPNPGAFTANQITLNNGALLGTVNSTLANGNAGITLGSSGGTIAANPGVTLTIPVAIAGTGSLTTGGPGNVVFSAANNYQGATLITGGGTAGIAASGLLGSTGGVTTIGVTSGDNPTLSLASSSGTLTGSGITIAAAAGSQGTVNQSAGLVSSTGSVLVGSLGAATYNLSGGTLVGGSGLYSAGTQIQVGAGAGSTGTLNVSSLGVLKTSGSSNLRLGTNATAQGTIVQSGTSTVSVGGDLVVGDVGAGSYTLNAGTLNAAANLAVGSSQFAVVLGYNPATSGTFVQTGGLLTNGTNLTMVGYAVSSTGSYTLHGGTLTTGDFRTDYGTGTFYQDGGNLNVNYWLRMGLDAGSTANYTIAGGTTTVGGTNTAMRLNVGEAGTGILTIGGSNGGTVLVTTGNTLTVAYGAGTGTLNLQPNGLLLTPYLLQGPGSAAFNFSGGTLQNAPGTGLNATMAAVTSGTDTIAVDAGQTASFSTAAGLSGSGSLVKNGGGTLVLSGWDTYNGGTTIKNGTLEFYYLGSVPSSGSITVNSGAAVALNAANLQANLLGHIAPSSSGMIALTTANSGDVINFNTAGLSNATLGVWGTGTVTYSGSFTPYGNTYYLSGGSGTLVMANNLALTDSGATSNNLVVSGGRVTLAGSNTYSGGTTVSGGTLNIASDASLGNVLGGLAFTGNSSLQFGGGFATSPSRTASIAGGVTATFDTQTYFDTFAGAIGGSGGLAKVGAGTLALSNSTNSYSGSTTLAAGVLQLAGSENAGTGGPLGIGGTILFAGGTLQYSPVNAYDYSARFSTPSNQFFNVDTNGQNVTWASPLVSPSGTLTKLGSGALTLPVANTYSGVTTLSAGTLVAGNIQAFGTNATAAALTLNGGVLDLQTDTSINPYNTTVGGTVTILSDRATQAAPGITHTLGNLSIGANTLTIDQGVNVSGGAPAVSFGTATLTGAATINTNAGVSTTLAAVAGGANALTIGGAGNTAIAGNAVNGNLTKNGAGTLTLTGSMAVAGSAWSHAGTLLLSNGTLTTTGYSSFGQLNGDTATVTAQGNSRIAVNGDFNVSDQAGSAGTMTLMGNSTAQGINTYIGKTSATGVLTLQNSAAFAATGYLWVGDTGTAVGTLNLQNSASVAVSGVFEPCQRHHQRRHPQSRRRDAFGRRRRFPHRRL